MKRELRYPDYPGPSPRPENPYLGDVHVTGDYPPGTPPEEITDFEVWNGVAWVHASDMLQSMNIQINSSK